MPKVNYIMNKRCLLLLKGTTPGFPDCSEENVKELKSLASDGARSLIAANTGLFQRLRKRLQQLNGLSLHNTSKGSLM